MSNVEGASGQRRIPEIYLDSSDFSVLSDPRRQNAGVVGVREALLNFARKREAQFRLSMAHVCEAAPAQAGAEEAAIRRAALMRELCGQNTLVSVHEIVDAEAQEIANFDARSTDRWVPPISDILSPDVSASLAGMAQTEIQQLPNREMRRKAKRALMHEGKLRVTVMQQMSASQSEIVSEMMRVMPLSDEEARAVSAYLAGRGGREAAERALMRIFCDPEWLMRRVATKPEEVQKMTEWIRGGGANFARNMGEHAVKLRQVAVTWKEASDQRLTDIAQISDEIVRAELETFERKLRQEMAGKLIFRAESLERTCILAVVQKSGGPLTRDSEAPLAQLRSRFPGIACTVAAGVHAAKRASAEKQSRPMKESDFGDAMHAVYAPYVDLYRTDGFMIEPVRRALQGRATVVPTLMELPDAIRAWHGANPA